MKNKEKKFDNCQKEYVEDLEYFLKFSSEDTVDVNGILKQFPGYAGRTLESLKSRGSGRILDIGSGNGAKAIYLARRLHGLGVSVVIDSIEPKTEQRGHLLEHYAGDNLKFRGKISDKTLAGAGVKEEYDIVLVIHVLYEFPRAKDDTIISLDMLGRAVTPDGAGIIIIEHPDGDFQRMKRELYPRLGKKAPVSLDLVLKTLKKSKIPHKLGEEIDFKFSLDKIIDKTPAEIGKEMSFLFSDSLEERPMGESEHQLIGSWAKDNARSGSKGHRYLFTPDIAVWTFKFDR
jgi:SAM-dependent methyltransferase